MIEKIYEPPMIVLRPSARSRTMSEALLSSVIQKLNISRYCEVAETHFIDWVIKDVREIADIVRDKKLEDGRRLNFLVSDIVSMAEHALDLFKQDRINYDTYPSFKAWIKLIKQQMLKLGDDEAEMESNMRSPENVEDDMKYVVGLEEDVQMLLRKRIIGGYHMTVLITGMSGIGKTTLAREIYNHPTVIERFKRRVWVSNYFTYFTNKELLIKVIQQVEDPQNLHSSSLLENMDNQSLIDMLSQHLQGKRYLIVLDDVPRNMYFNPLLKALQKEDNGSRLLLTSHTRNTGIYTRDEDVHKMKPLDSKKSWQLFLKTINHGNKLTGEHKFPKSLEPKGKQMLRKCDGLPLAIKEVGKQLVEKKLSGGTEWEQLLESVDFGSTLKLLEPFYHKLDPELESCFLCMSFFKENTTLRAEKLTQIWTAGGVVSGYRGSYLYGLINESVIDVKDKSTKYRMNALLHMLSIQKAEEKLGFEILRNNGNNRSFPSPRLHRVIICSRDKFNYSTDQDKHLVSLFFHGGGFFDTSSSYWKGFEELKILDLEDFGLKFLPETISRLWKLRYVGLRNNYIKELPRSLGCLKELEVLDIAQNFMVEVPDIIWEMRSLCHLYLSGVICRKPLKIDALRKLKTLTYVSVDDWTYELSGLKLSYLTKLGIEELDESSDLSKLFESLNDLYNLTHLILRGYRFRRMPSLDELGFLERVRILKLDGLLARLPSNLPPNITSLTLIDSCLDEDPMALLSGKLPTLEYLKLRNAYTGQQMVILRNGFQRLQVMCIEELWNLRNLQSDALTFRFKKLEIHDCPNLTLPENILSMSYLNELKMVTTKSIATKMRNSDLISKIPVVNINP